MNRRELFQSVAAVLGVVALAPLAKVLPAPTAKPGLMYSELRSAINILRHSGVVGPVYAVVHPNTLADMFSDTQLVNVFRWQRQGPPEVIGEFMGVTFVESMSAPEDITLMGAA